MTSQQLKAFRTRFALTQAQAAHLLGRSRLVWKCWEEETTPTPANLPERLQRVAKGLERSLAFRARWCHKCGRSVVKWRASGGTFCPYCSTPLHRQLKLRILEVLPPIKEAKNIDKEVLQQLGYIPKERKK